MGECNVRSSCIGQEIRMYLNSLSELNELDSLYRFYKDFFEINRCNDNIEENNFSCLTQIIFFESSVFRLQLPESLFHCIDKQLPHPSKKQA